MAEHKQLKRRNATTAAISLSVVAAMAGLAFASAPLYRMICKAIGAGGTTQVATAAPSVISDEPVTVRFDANTDPALPWQFKASQKSVTIKFGETATITYHAKNTSNRTIAGTATFNVTPEKVGIYFNKLACFCFQETVLKPGEEVDLPVTFFVDPDLLKDEYASDARTLTLSYTFFPSLNGVPVESKPVESKNVAAAPSAAVSK